MSALFLGRLSNRFTLPRRLLSGPARNNMGLHHLMIGTWTPPGAIFTVQFDDEKLELTLVKKTDIPHDEPISWMTFDVCTRQARTPE